MRRTDERASRLLVLGWHNVDGTWNFPAKPGAGRRGMARQLTALSKLASVVPLTWALERLHNGVKLPPRAVALTFDDGYADTLTLAVPLLERLRLPATLFLVPEFPSRTARPWWENLAFAVTKATTAGFEWEGASYSLVDTPARSNALSRLTRSLQFRPGAARRVAMTEVLERLGPTPPAPELMMDWDGARELARRGFDIQSHTMAHAVLAQETAKEQQRDLRMAREALERETGTEITSIAYPHGTAAHYDAATLESARAAGYRWGITTREGFTCADTPRLEVRRCVIYPERGIADLLAQLRYVFPRG